MPEGLRSAGYVVHTMWSFYGPGAEQPIEDVRWITEGARKDWILITRDEKIRYVRVEREAIEQSGARVFRVLSSARDARTQLAWLLNNMNRIIQRSRKPGPFVDVVHKNRVQRQWPTS